MRTPEERYNKLIAAALKWINAVAQALGPEEIKRQRDALREIQLIVEDRAVPLKTGHWTDVRQTIGILERLADCLEGLLSRLPPIAEEGRAAITRLIDELRWEVIQVTQDGQEDAN